MNSIGTLVCTQCQAEILIKSYSLESAQASLHTFKAGQRLKKFSTEYFLFYFLFIEIFYSQCYIVSKKVPLQISISQWYRLVH